MPGETSKVLTLVFTDLVDSTGLKTTHGDIAVGELITRHRKHVTRLAEECAGRIIDWAGDGCFLAFDTSSAAVMFGLRLQQVHTEESDLPEVRVGIHMGEVTEKIGPDGTTPRIEGLAVDLSARIQGLARPGQVLMSSAVYQSARQRLGVDTFGTPLLWQAHGNYKLKGYDDPVDIAEAGLEGMSELLAPEASEKARPYENVPGRESRSRVPAALVTALIAVLAMVGFAALRYGNSPPENVEPEDVNAPITALAVLPLENLSNDPEQEYFADGMTEALTAELAKIKSLKVVSRTSTLRYKKTILSVPEIAAELNVNGLIEGSVLRDGDEVRITVQLIDARTDTHVWSESYLDTITSVLKLQSEVSLAIAETIRAELTPDERERIASAREVNPEAYDLYLKAVDAMIDISPLGLFQVRQLFSQAVALDPEFAEAWLGVSRANVLLGSYVVGPPRAFFNAAQEAAVRALELDPGLGEAHVVLGHLEHILNLDWDAARAGFARARELAPNSASVAYYEAMFKNLEGDPIAAMDLAKRVMELSPYSAYMTANVALVLMAADQYDQAFQILERELGRNPDHVLALINTTWLHLHHGDYEASLEYVARVESATGPVPSVRATRAGLHAALGREEEAWAELDRLTASANPEILALSPLPWVYFALDDFDTGFDWLERGAESPSGLYFIMLRYSPFAPFAQQHEHLAKVGDHPRYWRLIERLGFPQLKPEHPGYPHEQARRKRKAEETAGARVEN